jgi:hypothetical protein
MTQHTKTPWRVQATYPVLVEGQMADGMWALVADAGGDVDMPQTEWASNAAFIVKAVNMHDALVEALRDLSEASRNACNAAQHTPLIDALFAADELIAKATP